jgi:hypothetical protein
MSRLPADIRRLLSAPSSGRESSGCVGESPGLVHVSLHRLLQLARLPPVHLLWVSQQQYWVVC